MHSEHANGIPLLRNFIYYFTASSIIISLIITIIFITYLSKEGIWNNVTIWHEFWVAYTMMMKKKNERHLMMSERITEDEEE